MSCGCKILEQGSRVSVWFRSNLVFAGPRESLKKSIRDREASIVEASAIEIRPSLPP